MPAKFLQVSQVKEPTDVSLPPIWYFEDDPGAAQPLNLIFTPQKPGFDWSGPTQIN